MVYCINCVGETKNGAIEKSKGQIDGHDFIVHKTVCLSCHKPKYSILAPNQEGGANPIGGVVGNVVGSLASLIPGIGPFVGPLISGLFG